MDAGLVLNSAAVVLLIALFVADQYHASARQFSADCTKNPTRGRFLCADAPVDAEVAPPAGMTGHIGCAMSCTLDERCQHFNHFHTPSSSASQMGTTKCQLFYGKPTSFGMVDGCEHYHAIPAGACINTVSSVYWLKANG